MGGGGGSHSQTVGYWYGLGLHLVVCQGPVDAVQEIRVGERTAWGNARREPLPTGHGLGSIYIDQPNLFGGEAREGGVVGQVDILSGHAAQTRNDYLMSRLGAMIPAFRGVLSLVARRITYAANNHYMKPWAVRVRRFLEGWDGPPWLPALAECVEWDNDGVDTTIGMNPAHIIYQCITDGNWGMGYPATMIGDSFGLAASWLDFEGFGLNMVFTRQQPIEGFIASVLDHIGGLLYVDPESGKFELRLLRGDYVLDALPVLGPDEIVHMERFERAQWAELPNEITVVYSDWDNGKEATVSVENLAAIGMQGGVINQRREYPGISHPPLAARVALRDLRALGTPLARMRLSVARAKLDRMPRPGDVMRLVWPRLGIDGMAVRITGVDGGTLGSGTLRLDAVEDVYGMDDAVLASVPPAPPPPATLPLPPALVLAVEPNYWQLARSMSRADFAFLTDTDTYIGALVCAGGPNQINYRLITGNLTVHTDAGVGEYAPLFQLDTALPASESDAMNVAVTQVGNPERISACQYAYLVNDTGNIVEAVALLGHDAALTHFDLARGVLDTTPKAHPAGTRMIGVGNWIAMERQERAPGESVYVAATPTTSTGLGTEQAAVNCTPLMQLTGRWTRPYPPGRVRINTQIEPAVVAGDLAITWAHRDRTQQTAYLVRQDEGDIGPEPGVTYRVVIKDRNGGTVHTENGIGATSWTWPVATAATEAGVLADRITVEISAVRGTLVSLQSQLRTMDRTGYGLRYGQYFGGL